MATVDPSTPDRRKESEPPETNLCRRGRCSLGLEGAAGVAPCDLRRATPPRAFRQWQARIGGRPLSGCEAGASRPCTTAGGAEATESLERRAVGTVPLNATVVGVDHGRNL